MAASTIKQIFLFLFLVVLALIYWRFNPSAVDYFPKCPFLQITGLKCPGCGSQRAVHFLLNGRLRAAFFENPLLVAIIPYLVAGLLFETLNWKEKYPAARKFLFGPRAVLVVLFVVVGFWILRNVQ